MERFGLGLAGFELRIMIDLKSNIFALGQHDPTVELNIVNVIFPYYIEKPDNRSFGLYDNS